MPGRPTPEFPRPIPEQSDKGERLSTPNQILLFKTVNGEVMAWGIQTDLSGDDILDGIEAAAEEWLHSPEGQQFIAEEDMGEWGFDYANALQEIPTEILRKHGIRILVSGYEVIELESWENLLPYAFMEQAS